MNFKFRLWMIPLALLVVSLTGWSWFVYLENQQRKARDKDRMDVLRESAQDTLDALNEADKSLEEAAKVVETLEATRRSSFAFAESNRGETTMVLGYSGITIQSPAGKQALIDFRDDLITYRGDLAADEAAVIFFELLFKQYIAKCRGDK